MKHHKESPSSSSFQSTDHKENSKSWTFWREDVYACLCFLRKSTRMILKKQFHCLCKLATGFDCENHQYRRTSGTLSQCDTCGSSDCPSRCNQVATWVPCWVRWEPADESAILFVPAGSKLNASTPSKLSKDLMASKWLMHRDKDYIFSTKDFSVSGERWSSCVVRCGLGLGRWEAFYTSHQEEQVT